MWHLLRSTNIYDYTINSSTKRLDTYGGNPLRILSLIRRTHVYYINRTILHTNQAPPHRSYCHTDRFSTAPAISSAPASSSTLARSSESGIPSELEIPGSDPPDSGIHPARFPMTPLAFPCRFPRYVAGEGMSLLPRTFRRHPHPPLGCQPRSP